MNPKPRLPDLTTALKEKLQQLRAPLQPSSESEQHFNAEFNAQSLARQEHLRAQLPISSQEDN